MVSRTIPASMKFYESDWDMGVIEVHDSDEDDYVLISSPLPEFTPNDMVAQFRNSKILVLCATDTSVASQKARSALLALGIDTGNTFYIGKELTFDVLNPYVVDVKKDGKYTGNIVDAIDAVEKLVQREGKFDFVFDENCPAFGFNPNQAEYMCGIAELCKAAGDAKIISKKKAALRDDFLNLPFQLLYTVKNYNVFDATTFLDNCKASHQFLKRKRDQEDVLKRHLSAKKVPPYKLSVNDGICSDISYTFFCAEPIVKVHVPSSLEQIDDIISYSKQHFITPKTAAAVRSTKEYNNDGVAAAIRQCFGDQKFNSGFRIIDPVGNGRCGHYARSLVQQKRVKDVGPINISNWLTEDEFGDGSYGTCILGIDSDKITQLAFYVTNGSKRVYLGNPAFSSNTSEYRRPSDFEIPESIACFINRDGVHWQLLAPPLYSDHPTYFGENSDPFLWQPLSFFSFATALDPKRLEPLAAINRADIADLKSRRDREADT